ncbi:MAG: hypothetical protein MJZ11_10575 [Lachnospiraceae bacterium]|nr:hypothetical protein [Lachnospiraceae bacterium]
MANEEQEKDRLIEIQDKMNSMDVIKRKRSLMIFAFVCAAIILLRLVVSLGGCSRNKGNEDEALKAEEVRKEQQQVLEYSLERKKQLDSNFEEMLDKLVEEDRKEREYKNGEAK